MTLRPKVAASLVLCFSAVTLLVTASPGWGTVAVCIFGMGYSIHGLRWTNRARRRIDEDLMSLASVYGCEDILGWVAVARAAQHRHDATARWRWLRRRRYRKAKESAIWALIEHGSEAYE